MLKNKKISKRFKKVYIFLVLMQKYEPLKEEPEILKFWRDNRIYEKSGLSTPGWR